MKKMMMRAFPLVLVPLLLAACKDDAAETKTVEVPQKCDTDSDCECDSDFEPDCKSGQCRCEKTETVVETGPSCEKASDCTTCDSGFTADCKNQVCTCTHTETVTVTKESCTTATDCTMCDPAAKTTCEDSKCVCTVTETVTETAPSCTDATECDSCAPGFEVACIDNKCYCAGSTQLPSCTQDAHCTATCTNGTATCVDNQCVCTVENPSCTVKADCDQCPQGSVASCLGNACYCTQTVEVPTASCFKASDCSCSDNTVADCEDQKCYCRETVTAPSCTHETDCTCAPGFTASCVGEQCYCAQAPACTVATDCNVTCGAGAIADCVSGQCKCTVEVEIGCIDETDCSCPVDTEAVCDVSGICYCNQPAPPPQNQVIMLSAFNADPVVVAGSQGLPSATYMVFGTSSASPLNTLTIKNQPNGEGSPAVGTSAISQVYVSCSPPSGTGNGTSLSSSLNTAGTVTFAGLGCYDETGNGLKVELTYNVNTTQVAGETLSGQEFRLVVDGVPHSLVGNKVVRKTILSYTDAPAGSTTLTNGQRSLKAVNVAAHNAGSGAIARHVYGVQRFDANAGGQLQLSEFSYFRGSDVVTGVSIRDLDGHDLSGTTALVGSIVVVSFTEEQVVGAGTTVQYNLQAMAAGVEVGDKVTTWLMSDNTPVMGKTAYGAANTARLVSSNPAAGLFGSLNEFRFGHGQNLNVIVSDLSSDAHVFALTEGGSSSDWFNGYGQNQATTNNTLVAQ